MYQNKKKGILFVISAPSGAGKTTLTNTIINKLSKKNNIRKTVTYTTRSPRPEEINGIDYNFLSKEKFKKLIQDNFFLETTKYNGEYYGSPKTVLNDVELGKSFIIVTDLVGVRKIKQTAPFSKFIWIDAPNLKELKKRLSKRKTSDKKHVKKRLKLAEEEIIEAKKTNLFDFKVVNDNFNETVEKIILFIKKELKI